MSDKNDELFPSAVPQINFSVDSSLTIKRKDIYLADMSLSIGSEQAGIRYVLVISNDIGNKFSPTVEVCCITSQDKAKIPTHVEMPIGNHLPKHSVIMTEQKRTIDKMRLITYMGNLNQEIMNKVDNALRISIAL